MLVSMWMARKTIDNMETRRWSSWWAKPGQLRARARAVVVSPRTMVNVSRTSATIPLARVTYQKTVEFTGSHARKVIEGRGVGHREVPPDVTTGRVVVVVGGDVVVVVVGGVVVGVVVGDDVVGVVVAPDPTGDSVVGVVVVPDPAGDSVVGVVVVGVVADVVVEVDGTEVEVLPLVVVTAELAPGCSFATTTPMSAVAPAAPTIEARVRKRTSAWPAALLPASCGRWGASSGALARRRRSRLNQRT